MLRTALSKMAATHATRTIQKAHNCLTRAVRHAEGQDLVRRNVSALVDTPQGQAGRPSQSLTLEQAGALRSWTRFFVLGRDKRRWHVALGDHPTRLKTGTCVEGGSDRGAVRQRPHRHRISAQLPWQFGLHHCRESLTCGFVACVPLSRALILGRRRVRSSDAYRRTSRSYSTCMNVWCLPPLSGRQGCCGWSGCSGARGRAPADRSAAA